MNRMNKIMIAVLYAVALQGCVVVQQAEGKVRPAAVAASPANPATPASRVNSDGIAGSDGLEGEPGAPGEPGTSTAAALGLPQGPGIAAPSFWADVTRLVLIGCVTHGNCW